MTKFKADPSAIYFTDNGATLCGVHLGSSAKHTGRDISGQRIQKVTDADVAEAMTFPEYGGDRDAALEMLSCEYCGAQHGDKEAFASNIAKPATMTGAQLAALVVPASKVVRAVVR